MNNFIFFKKRDFSSLISDSIDFFKIYFGNFAKNFIVVNSVLVLGFFVLVSVFLTQNWENFKNFEDFVEYASVSFWISISIIVLVFVLILILINSFTMIYVKIASDNPSRKDFTSMEIYEEMRNAFLPILSFSFLSFFILGIPYILVSVLLMIIPLVNLISSFVLPMVFAIVWNLSLFKYIFEKKPYFESISSAFEILKVEFWHKVGATMVMNVIIYFALLFVIVLPALLSLGMALSGFFQAIPPLISVILTAVFWGVIMVILLMISNILSIMFMMMYFSENDKKIEQDDLDKIGTGNNDF